MHKNWKSIALLISISLNIAVVAGYLSGAVFPRTVQSSPPRVPPGLRDPNLTSEQIQAIKKVQAIRIAWLNDWRMRYQRQLLDIVDVLDAKNPDWAQVDVQQARLLKLRQDYQNVLFHSWSDINSVLTPQQGKQYMEALREIIRSIDFSKNANGG